MAEFFDGTYSTIDAPLEDITAGLSIPTFGQVQAPPKPDPVGFNEQTNQVYVNGSTFDFEDHQSALESEAYLSHPLTELPAGFSPIAPDDYKEYIHKIKNPSLGRLAAKNIGIGVDVSQQLAGGALKFFGAEETGQAIIEQQEEDIRRNQPYQRTFTDDAMKGRAGEWFVANAAQLAPLMAEMIITSAIGGFAGGAAAVGTGALARGGAKLALRGGAKRTADNAFKGLNQLRNNTLKKNSVEHKALRTVGRINGARWGALAASEGVALGDIYQEVEASGNYDSPAMARLVTALFSVPYAASEILPAQLALTYGMRSMRMGRKGGRLRRGAKAAGVGAVGEGSTEAFQEILAMGAAGELDLHDPEVINRLINSFAAGAGVGAPLGGLAGFVGKKPSTPKIDPEELNDRGKEVDLLKQGELFEGQDLGTAPVELGEGQVQGELFGDRGVEDRRQEILAQLEAVTDPNERADLELELDELDRPIGSPRVDTEPFQRDLFNLDEPTDILDPEPVPDQRGFDFAPQDTRRLEERHIDLRQAVDDLQAFDDQITDPAAGEITPEIEAIRKRMVGTIDARQRDVNNTATQLELPLPVPVPFPRVLSQRQTFPGSAEQAQVQTVTAPTPPPAAPTPPPAAPTPPPAAPVPEPRSFIPSPPGQLELSGSEQLLDQPASATSGPFNIAQSVLTYPGEPTVVTAAYVEETKEVVQQEVTVREAMEHSDQRMRSLGALRSCLRGEKAKKKS